MRRSFPYHRALTVIFSLAAMSCGKGDPALPGPSIEITSPTDGSLERESRIRVQGTAVAVDRVEVGGENAEVVGGKWEALVPVSQGEVTLTAAGNGASDSVTFTVDSISPALEVLTPERALYRTTADGDTIRVTGTVSDLGTGLEILRVNEQIITPAVSGNWQHDVGLQPGLNEINVVARDIAGNEVTDIRGVMFGDYIAPDATIEPAFNIWLDQQAGPVLEEVVEGFVTPANLTVLLEHYVQHDSIDIQSIRFDPVDFGYAPANGHVNLTFVATNVAISGMFTIGGDPQQATVDIARLGVSVEATPIVLDDGGLDVRFANPVLDLAPEDLSYDIAGLSDEDSQFLEEQIIDIAQTGFVYVLTQGIFDSLYDPAILTRKIELFGREVVFQLDLVSVDVFPEGILMKTRMTMPAERWPDVRADSPGALHRAPGPNTAPQTVEDIQFTITRNAADRIFHGVWYSGLLNYELAGNDFAGVTLPFELNAGALGVAFDAAITTVAPATTPAAVRLRPMFPPVAEYDVENARLLMRVGEFMVDLLLLPAGQDPIVVATISTFLDLSVKLSVEGVLVKLAFETELRADLAAEPATDLDDEKAEDLLEGLVALIPSLVAQELLLQGEQDINWVKLEPPRVEVHGTNRDWGTISMGMTANPQELPPPDTDPDDGM